MTTSQREHATVDILTRLDIDNSAPAFTRALA